jgi:hypothetical protein
MNARKVKKYSTQLPSLRPSDSTTRQRVSHRTQPVQRCVWRSSRRIVRKDDAGAWAGIGQAGCLGRWMVIDGLFSSWRGHAGKPVAPERPCCAWPEGIRRCSCALEVLRLGTSGVYSFHRLSRPRMIMAWRQTAPPRRHTGDQGAKHALEDYCFWVAGRKYPTSKPMMASQPKSHLTWNLI